MITLVFCWLVSCVVSAFIGSLVTALWHSRAYRENREREVYSGKTYAEYLRGR